MRIELSAIIALLALAALAWMGRYEIISGGPYGALYKMDRWTGEVETVETQQQQQQQRGTVSPYAAPQYGQPR